MRVKRVFSGIQPTGQVHIGNYLGAMRHWVAMQEEYDCLYCIVDLHALTVPHDPAELNHGIEHMAALMLAAGLDPRRSVVFVQSTVPQHAELAWILSGSTQFGELSRMTQFKAKSEGKETVSAGLFTYPVLMAADVLLYDAHLVPVGEDQKQHVELMRDVAQRFNQRFGETFVVPEPKIAEVGARIMSLDDPTAKMSKSDPAEGSKILLTDPPDVIVKKIKRAVTDSGREVYYDEEEKAGIANLLTIHSLFSGEPIDDLVERYRDSGYGRFKMAVAEAVVEGLKPLQERYKEIMADREGLRRVLAEGRERAQVLAAPKIEEVHTRLGLGMPRG